MSASSFDISTAHALVGTAVASTGTAVGLVGWAPLSALSLSAAVLFMALTGTAAGLLWNPPQGSRRRMFALAFVFTVVAAALAVLVAEAPWLAWIKPVTPCLALVLAFFSQTLLPALGTALADRAKRTIGGTP
ncbi:MAG TPA: hypothetical protein VIG88_09470 [Lysobacter sp.]